LPELSAQNIDDIGPPLGGATCLGEQIENRGVGLDGIATGSPDFAEHGNALAAGTRNRKGDMGSTRNCPFFRASSTF